MSVVPTSDSERLAIYQREVLTQRVKSWITGALVVCFVLSIGILYSGQGLYKALRAVGLDSLLYPRGNKVDCQSALNAGSDLCNPRMSRAERSWRNLDPGRGKSAAFSLNDR